MPYALSNLKDGLEPSYRYVSDPSHAAPGEVVVADADFRPDWVWDAVNGRLRPRTDAEVLAKVKGEKKKDGANRMHRENRALYSEVFEVDGAWVAEFVLDTITEPRGARVASVKANKDRRARFYAAVEASTTLDAVRAVAWETV
ncbi:MAG: hypothetical protein M3P49_08195 [Actinomycetota bacterium]|nr:hypothetical protein [Actinomycetota bacterium]